MTKEIERRTSVLGVETRADQGGKKKLYGYAAIFNSDTEIGDLFVERIDKGAFDTAIKGDVRALIDHDAGRVIGRTKSGTLKLSTDSKGLAVEIDVPDTADGRDLMVLVERGDISGMSFGFRVLKQEWDETGDMPVRTILDVELYEVSAVAFPAYESTEIDARSIDAARAELEAIRKEAQRKKDNGEAAKRRIAERHALTEQKIRGIR